MCFVWKPGTAPSDKVFNRLEKHLPKPEEEPPQAWFMGDEVTYWGDPLVLPPNQMEHYLQDTSSGLRNFPEVEFAVKSWKDTFHYLLPRLLPHADEEYYLLADLIGYFIHVYPDQIADVYPEFRSDILETLGTAIMVPKLWNGKDFSNDVIERDRKYWLSYGENCFITNVTAAMYFCLKYLTPLETETWCESIFQISGIHWHYNFMYWLYQETFSLLYPFEANGLPENYAVNPNMGIGVNTRVHTIYLPTQNVKTFIRMLQKHHVYYAADDLKSD